MNVLTCTARHDGAYLVTFKRPGSSKQEAAVSTTPMEPGDSFQLRHSDGAYAIAVPNRKSAR